MKTKNYEYRMINTKALSIDTLYQRAVDTARVSKIVKQFRPELVNAIKVSYREGKFWVFDGQHTIEALKAVNHGKDLPVECKVFEGLTWLDECDLFILQNGVSRSVNMNDRFKARYNRGDEDVKRMVEIAQDLGIRVDFSGAKGQNKIVALTTLNRCYHALGEDEYRNMLWLIKETWGGDEMSWNSEMLKGMFIFMTTYKGQFLYKNFVERVGKVSPTVIIREAKASTDPGFAKYARQILKAYNYKAKNRLPDLL